MKKTPVPQRTPLVTWLHTDAPPIVYRTPKAVDGAPLPYTAAMLARRATRELKAAA